MTKRNRDALAISDGACNPVAIVNSMVAAIAEMRAAPNVRSLLGNLKRLPAESASRTGSRSASASLSGAR